MSGQEGNLFSIPLYDDCVHIILSFCCLNTLIWLNATGKLWRTFFRKNKNQITKILCEKYYHSDYVFKKLKNNKLIDNSMNDPFLIFKWINSKITDFNYLTSNNVICKSNLNECLAEYVLSRKLNIVNPFLEFYGTRHIKHIEVILESIATKAPQWKFMNIGMFNWLHSLKDCHLTQFYNILYLCDRNINQLYYIVS